MTILSVVERLEEAQMRDDALRSPIGVLVAFHDPGQRLAQGFAQARPTGFADGRQLCVGPLIRMALPQLPHQETGR